MYNIIKEIIENIKSKFNGIYRPCYAGASILSTTNKDNKGSNINCFWMPSFDNPKPTIQTQKQPQVKSREEKQLEKMKMILNNLQQKLNDELCGQVSDIIDMVVETSAVIKRLSKIDTVIPAVRMKINNLKEECLEDCKIAKSNVLQKIRLYAIQVEANSPEEYVRKVDKTICYCVENYDVYRKVDYRKRYGHKSSQNIEELSLDDIIKLL